MAESKIELHTCSNRENLTWGLILYFVCSGSKRTIEGKLTSCQKYQTTC